MRLCPRHAPRYLLRAVPRRAAPSSGCVRRPLTRACTAWGGAPGARTVDSLKAQLAELRKGLEAVKAQLGSSLQAQAVIVQASAQSVDELRQRQENLRSEQENLRSDLIAAVHTELKVAPNSPARTAASVAHGRDVEELRAHDLDHEERLLRQQASTEELRACNPIAPRLQPYASRQAPRSCAPATPLHPGCNPMRPGKHGGAARHAA